MQFTAIRSVKAWGVVPGDGELCHLHPRRAQRAAGVQGWDRQDTLPKSLPTAPLPSFPGGSTRGIQMSPAGFHGLPLPAPSRLRRPLQQAGLRSSLSLQPREREARPRGRGLCQLPREHACSAGINTSGTRRARTEALPALRRGAGAVPDPSGERSRPGPRPWTRGAAPAARPLLQVGESPRPSGLPGGPGRLGGRLGEGSQPGASARGDASAPRCQWPLGTSLMGKPCAQGCGCGGCLGQLPGSPGTAPWFPWDTCLVSMREALRDQSGFLRKG